MSEKKEKEEKELKDEKEAAKKRLNSLHGFHPDTDWRDKLLLEYIERDVKDILTIKERTDAGDYCKDHISRHSIFKQKMTWPIDAKIGQIHVRDLDKNSFNVFISGHRVLEIFDQRKGRPLGQIWFGGYGSDRSFVFRPTESKTCGLGAQTLKDIAFLCKSLTKWEKNIK